MLDALLAPQFLQLLDGLFSLIDHAETDCSLDEGKLRFTAITHATHEFTQVQDQTHPLSRRRRRGSWFFTLYFLLGDRGLSWRSWPFDVRLISVGKCGKHKEQSHIGIDAYLAHIDVDVHSLFVHCEGKLQELLSRAHATASIENLHVTLEVPHILHGVFCSIAQTVENTPLLQSSRLPIVLNGCSVELPHGHFRHHPIIISREQYSQIGLLEEGNGDIILRDEQGDTLHTESQIERILLLFLLGIGLRRRRVGRRIE
jgi:hypothetical protein